MAFLKFLHILWDKTKPTFVLSDNKLVTGFFQAKAIPPTLWNACDYVFQFNFKIAHFIGSVNAAADFLSRLESKVTEKILPKCGRMYKQHPSRWKHLPQMLQMKNSSSSRKQMVEMEPRNRSFLENSNISHKQQNWQQMRNHPQWSQVPTSSQRSTETLRRIPRVDSTQTQENEQSKKLI